MYMNGAGIGTLAYRTAIYVVALGTTTTSTTVRLLADTTTTRTAAAKSVASALFAPRSNPIWGEAGFQPCGGTSRLEKGHCRQVGDKAERGTGCLSLAVDKRHFAAVGCAKWHFL